MRLQRATTGPAGGGSPSPATVRDVLDLDAMVDGEILAGKSGLDREVTGANIIEVPDVAQWLRGGEFLFTAGYAYRDDPKGLERLISELDRIGVAALGFKLGRYLRRVPQSAITLADELGFPLVRMPSDIAYMDVIEPLYRKLAEQRLWVLERSAQAMESFASLGLDYQSTEKIVGALAAEVNDPTYLVDLLDDSVCIGGTDGTAETFEIGDLEGERRSIARGVIGLTLRRQPTPFSLEDASGLGASIAVGKTVQGRLVLIERDAPLDEFAELTLAHAAELLAFLQMKQVAILDARREAADLFLQSLLSDTMSNEEAAERALSLGLRLTRPSTALIVGVADPPEEWRATLQACVQTSFSHLAHVAGTSGDEIIVFVQAGDEDHAGTVEQCFDRLAKIAQRNGLGELIGGCGSALTGLGGVRRSRSEAQISLQVARRLGHNGLLQFDDLGVERVLAQVPRSDVINDYLRSTIGALEERPEFVDTLEVFLEHGGNKVATAAALPMHRSSLVYRLNKISDMLGSIDLDDPERRFELWLALRLRRIVGLTGDSPD